MRLIPLAPALALLGCLACSKVDETGYFHEESIHYSAEGSLSPSNDGAVILVGEEGAVDVAGGLLIVEVERTGTSFPGAVDPETRSLACGLSARKGDTLHLRYTVDGDDSEMTVALDQNLASVPAPDCTGCGVGWSLVSAPVGGQVTVDLSVLDDPTPPFVIANVDGGTVVVAESVDQPVSIPAVSGAQVCVHQRRGGVSSPARCAVVP